LKAAFASSFTSLIKYTNELNTLLENTHKTKRKQTDMACGDFGAGDCYDTLGNKLYFGLRLDQLLGVVSGYLLLFALLAMHYHKFRAASRSMAVKVDSMTVKLENMESQLARLESIHIVLEAMPQLLEQRLHGTNTKYILR